MAGLIAYFVILGSFIILAAALMFSFRAIKLI